MENVVLVERFGSLGVVILVAVWVMYWLPKWVALYAAHAERRLAQDDASKALDRTARREDAALFAKAVSDMYQGFYGSLSQLQDRFDQRADKVAASLGEVCRYKKEE